MFISDILHFIEEKGFEHRFVGDKECDVQGYSTLKNYKRNTVTWAKNKLAYNYQMDDKLLVIAQEGLEIDAQNVIYSKESKRIFFDLVAYMAEGNNSSSKQDDGSIGEGTVIGNEVIIGHNVRIGANCVIVGDIVIGENTRIWNNVTIMNHVVIGKGCEIQSGSVIGHDGFAWNEDETKKKEMIKHFGGVAISDDVYIGPNCIVDRGEIDNTTIGQGCKIDGGCFIAHNVVMGKNIIMIAGSRLYGSVVLGDNAYIASATVRNQCKVGENAKIGIGAVVTKNIPADVTAIGVPARIMSKS